MLVWHIAEALPLPAGIDDNGVCGWFVYTELEIKIVFHGSLLPTDILHHPTGR